MSSEWVKVTEYVRGVVDGRVVVRRPGARIPIELAMKLGIHEGYPPESHAGGRKRPRKPAGAQLPARRTTGRR